jgi:hypothetical protein
MEITGFFGGFFFFFGSRVRTQVLVLAGQRYSTT